MNYLKLGAVAGVLALLIATQWYIGGLQDQRTALQAQVADLNGRLELQNLAVLKLETDSAARLKSAEAALRLAKRQAAKRQAAAQIIYRAVPSQPGDRCSSALDLINVETK